MSKAHIFAPEQEQRERKEEELRRKRDEEFRFEKDLDGFSQSSTYTEVSTPTPLNMLLPSSSYAVIHVILTGNEGRKAIGQRASRDWGQTEWVHVATEL